MGEALSTVCDELIISLCHLFPRSAPSNAIVLSLRNCGFVERRYAAEIERNRLLVMVRAESAPIHHAFMYQLISS